MARHKWSITIKQKPRDAVSKDKCSKCGLTRIGYRYVKGGRITYDYKRGHSWVNGTGTLMGGTPPCDERFVPK